MSNQKVTDIFAALRAKIELKLQELPEIIGNTAVNYSLEAFEKEAWEGLPWAQRLAKKDAARALLVKSGRLKRSIRIIRTTASSVTIGTDVPYAQVHNDGLLISRAARSETFVRPRYARGPKSKYFGGKGAFRKITREERAAAPAQGQSYKAHSYTMTRRRFLGYTPELRDRIRLVAKEEFTKAINA